MTHSAALNWAAEFLFQGFFPRGLAIEKPTGEIEATGNKPPRSWVMATAVAVEPRNDTKTASGAIAGNRWIQLICGIIAMILVSNYQYAFTLFTPGMKQTFAAVPYAKIAAIFSAFILFETWPMPVAGYFVDKLGIRKLMTFGAICIALGWILGGTIATSPVQL
jgi:MFS family permease